MARYDIHRALDDMPHGYVLDVQADLLSHLDVRVVVPLLPGRARPGAIPDLSPVFDIGGEPHVLMPQLIASVPRSALGRPVGTLTSEHFTIVRALDILLTGF